MMGENPQHNRHIIEKADAIDATFNENNQQMMMLFRELSRRLDKLEADVEALTKTVETHTKNNPSTPIPVDIVPTQASLRRMRASIHKALN